MTKKEIKAAQKRIKEIKADMKEITAAFKSGEEWLDGEVMLENEYADYICELEDEMQDLQDQLTAA